MNDYTRQITDSEPEQKVYEYYTLFGQHDYLDSNHFPRIEEATGDVLAKSVTLGDNTKYFLKLGSHGKIYNPIGMYSEGTSNKFLSKIGKKAWEFKSVSPRVFELYTNFLKTKNIAWLRNAEREME
tara:strand:- start:420 stop:797 length:378 start_codon:yes stop_codon:yes gene_type:complete